MVPTYDIKLHYGSELILTINDINLHINELPSRPLMIQFQNHINKGQIHSIILLF